MTKNRWMRRMANVLLLVSLVVLATYRASAEQCSNRTTEGRYVVVGDGYLSTGPNTPLVPAKLLSVVTADAHGVYSGAGTISFGGQVLVQEVAGSQQLNADCTGSISYRQTLGGRPGPNINFTFVVSNHGNRIDGLSVDGGTVFSAVLRRLERSER